ncbi:hypothetical protein FH608_035700 [Nonomuraea phyllanthi]|uniref:Uncharacterized protein n=1 Tax=Nonomuraea phyllanthi TaxID=2219224 RepID=A0A5C4VX22_9ACTN|nr:hypothetical protein [Nonomuraea phyllanthi]KAB8190318.1 hypothetical protein FH608_035700 [Nonomuraea phyllanthi]QFY05561.1 hypothetical protein GBF35_01675 [Nonomuraea phyllanthi]
MADASVVTAIISAAGGMVGALSALGGVALTNRAAARKEEREARRRREEQHTQAREQAYGELLGGALKLRLQVEVAAHHPWEDMNERLAAIETQAASVGDLASRATVLSPGEVAATARALATAAYDLASQATRHTRMHYDEGGQFMSGQMLEPPAFQRLDQCVDDFCRVAVEPEAAQAVAERTAQAVATRSAQALAEGSSTS